MDLVAELLSAGFARVIVLDGSECGEMSVGSVLLAIDPYEAERQPAGEGAWIHPYYFASQQAYEKAADFARVHGAQGVQLRDDIRVKPIFARLEGFHQGRNTLSYLDGYGSRFHVQVLTVTPGLPATHHLTEEAHPLHCGVCRKCVDACPTNALEGGVFHRERCLRNWQMSGQPVPEELRGFMGNRLIGCDVCQRVCPHNPPAMGAANATVPLSGLLEDAKGSAQSLRPQIGVNLTLPNRLLGQACLLAGCSGKADLIPVVEGLGEHPSPTVSAHAKWALETLQALNGPGKR